MEVNSGRIEIERIDNMIRNFDWMITKQEIFDGKAVLTIEKKIEIPIKIPVTPAGN